jgi:putative transposase
LALACAKSAMVVKEKKHRLPGDCYKGRISVSFTLCIKNRLPLFANADIVSTFVEILEEVAAKYSCVIPAYCFMPDHVHLIVSGNEDDADNLKFLTAFKQKTGFWMSRNHIEARWQKDFFDHVIRKDENLSALIAYILDNPVRKGLVADWRDYPFKGSIGCNLDHFCPVN